MEIWLDNGSDNRGEEEINHLYLTFFACFFTRLCSIFEYNCTIVVVVCDIKIGGLQHSSRRHPSMALEASRNALFLNCLSPDIRSNRYTDSSTGRETVRSEAM